MSLDKAIEHGKEKRKPYRGSKAFELECRNHGACEICVGNRTIKFTRKEQAAKDKLSEVTELKTFEITAYIDGVKKNRVIQAKDKEEAKKIGWELFDADSICVDEVEE